MSKKVALIGECMIELNGQPFTEMMQTYGGDTLNTSVYLSRTSTNVDVYYVTAMGTDALSTQIIEQWQSEGVRTSLVLRDDKRQPGLYLIQLDKLGERSFLYWREQSAAKYLLQHPKFSAVISELCRMDMVYLSGISIAILPVKNRAKLLNLLRLLSANGVLIAFDSNFRKSLWGDNIDEVKALYNALFSICNLAFVTFDDEQSLWGDANSKASLTRLKQSGVKEVVLKLGDKGCLHQHFSSMESAQLIPAEQVENVVDTTSAGDSFNAGFLSTYLHGMPAREACVRGNKLAAMVIQHKGAIVPQEITRIA